MKKLLFVLMILSSFVFASVGEQLLYDSTNNIYKGVISGACYSKGSWFDWMRPSSSDAIYDFAMVNNGQSALGIFASDGTYQMYSFSIVSCPVITPTCAEGSHYDDTEKACVGDYKIAGVHKFDSGATGVSFDDGAFMFCRKDFKCRTTDKDGNDIPNRYYAGAIPETASEIGDIFSYGANSALSSAGNALGNLLIIGGIPLMYDSLGNSGVPGDDSVIINPFDSLQGSLGAAMIKLGDAMITDNDTVEYVPTAETASGGGVSINIKEGQNSASSLSSLSSSDGSSSSVPTTNGSQVQSATITPENIKAYQDKWAGQGSLGSTVLSASDQVAIIASQDKLQVVQKNTADTSTVLTINKSDLANTAQSGVDLPYTVKDVTKTINNNGTVTTTESNNKVGTASAATNNNTQTGTNGSTSTTNPTTGSTANGSNGTNFDISALTGRLDSMGNQLNKLNGLTESGNGLLEGINANTASAKNSLNGINSTLNSIKDTSGFSADVVQHNIPDIPSSMDNWQETWNNLKSDFDRVSNSASELNSFINGSALTLNLSHGSVTTCPYTQDIDFGMFSVPFNFDLCSFFSPYYPVFYLFTYFVSTFAIIFFAIKILFLIGV